MLIKPSEPRDSVGIVLGTVEKVVCDFFAAIPRLEGALLLVLLFVLFFS